MSPRIGCDIGARLSKFHSAAGNRRHNVGRDLFEELVEEFTDAILPAVICSEVGLACTTEAFLSIPFAGPLVAHRAGRSIPAQGWGMA
jgi:hypothetical protein